MKRVVPVHEPHQRKRHTKGSVMIYLKRCLFYPITVHVSYYTRPTGTHTHFLFLDMTSNVTMSLERD